MRRIMTATAALALIAAGPAFAQQAQTPGAASRQAGQGQAGMSTGYYTNPQGVERSLQQLEGQLGNAQQAIQQKNYKEANQNLQQAYLMLERAAATNAFGPATPMLVDLQQQIYTAHQAFQQNPMQAAGLIARVRNEINQFARSPQSYTASTAAGAGAHPAANKAGAAQNAGGNAGANGRPPQNPANGQ